MTNKIIKSLVSGTMSIKGTSSFNKADSAYFAEYQNGSIGVYANVNRQGRYVYNEYSVDEKGIVTCSVKPPRHFSLDSGINSFFDSIYFNNFRIATTPPEDIIDDMSIDGRFVIGIGFYDPRYDGEIETIEMTKYALSSTAKNQVVVAKAYFDKTSKTQVVVDAKNTLVKNLLDFIQTLIIDNQNPSVDYSAADQLLVLDLASANNPVVTEGYPALVKMYTDLGRTNAPSINDLISLTLANSPWVQAKPVVLSTSTLLSLRLKAKKKN